MKLEGLQEDCLLRSEQDFDLPVWSLHFNRWVMAKQLEEGFEQLVQQLWGLPVRYSLAFLLAMVWLD